MVEQQFGQLALVEHRREAVAAEQVHVAGARAVGAHVDLHAALRAQRARDDRALGVLHGLLGGQPALADELVDERVVVGEPLQAAVTQPVGATVADVRDHDLLLADIHGRQRRAHTRLLGVRLRQLMDARVGRLRERDQRGVGVCGVAQPFAEGLDGDLRGDLAGLGAAHPVGHDEQRRTGQQRVLVGAALAAGVGRGVLLGYAQHR